MKPEADPVNWLIVLHALDLITTYRVLAAGGYEAHPIGAAAIAAGWWAAVAGKAVVVAAVAGVGYWARSRAIYRRAFYGSAWAACAILGGVVGWNALLLI